MTKKLSNNQSLLRGFIEREFNRSDYTRVSDYFEFFAADKTLKEDELSADDINLGLMGRSGDGGCDGAYLSVIRNWYMRMRLRVWPTVHAKRNCE